MPREQNRAYFKRDVLMAVSSAAGALAQVDVLNNTQHTEELDMAHVYIKTALLWLNSLADTTTESNT